MAEAKIAPEATETEKPARRPRGRATTPRAPRARSGETTPSNPNVKHVHHVHFLEDGVTALDRVYLRGEEVQLKEGTQHYAMAHDADGNCLFAVDRNDQIRRFGKHLWDEGPWPFEPYDLQARLDNGETLTAEEQNILKRANAARFKKQPVGASRANNK